MKITKRKLQELIKESVTFTDTMDSIEDDAATVVDEILAIPGWAGWDESGLADVVEQEVGSLVPMPFDDDWPDLVAEVMAQLNDARNKAR